jgi:hypothetical protein
MEELYSSVCISVGGKKTSRLPGKPLHVGGARELLSEEMLCRLTVLT